MKCSKLVPIINVFQLTHAARTNFRAYKTHIKCLKEAIKCIIFSAEFSDSYSFLIIRSTIHKKCQQSCSFCCTDLCLDRLSTNVRLNKELRTLICFNRRPYYLCKCWIFLLKTINISHILKTYRLTWIVQ